MANRHDWLSWDQYQYAHESNLSRFPHFIVHDELRPAITERAVVWEGRLHCVDGWEISVQKRQEVRRRRGRREVRTVAYSYQVMVRTGRRVIEVLRYDNVHAHAGHADAHHKHVFEPGLERVEHVGEEQWPTLGDVISEVEHLWAAGRSE